MEEGQVTDRHVTADIDRKSGVGMDDSSILYV
jgi:hypothetical protein